MKLKKRWIFAAFFLILAFSIPFVRLGFSSDNDGDHIDDLIENAQKRQLTIETEQDAVTVKSEFYNQTGENEFEVKLQAKQDIHVEFGYSSYRNATQFELEMSVHYWRLIEFIDTNSDGFPNATEIIQTIDLTEKTYSQPSVTPITSEDGESGYRLESSLVSNNFVFGITVETFPKYAIVNQTSLKPTDTKITIVVKNFPYLQSNSLLALVAKMESEKEVEQKVSGQEIELEVNSTTAKGYYTWSKNATVDSSSKDTESSVQDDVNGKLITIVYPHGTDIVHDPLLGLSISSMSSSTDRDGDGCDDSIESKQERTLKIESESGSIKVISEFENQTLENELEFKLSAQQGINLELSFGTKINATEKEVEETVRFRQLIEFTDNNQDGLPSASEIVQTINLTQKSYSAPTLIQKISKDGETGYRLESHLINEAYTFQVIAEIFPKFAVMNQTNVQPTESKITIVIKDFPYVQNGSLALIMKVESEKEIEEKIAGVEKKVEVKSQNAQAYFSWSNNATIDGVSKDIKSSVANEGNDKVVTVAYPNGKSIVHDPKVGVTIAQITSGAGGLIGGIPSLWIYGAVVALLIAIALIVSLVIFRRRKQ